MGINIKKGFTFIEVVVVIGIVSLMIPAVFGIFYSILREQSRIYALTEVKRQGDNLLSKMENQISNNTLSLYSDINCNTLVCDNVATNQTVGCMIDNNNVKFRYDNSANQVSFISASGTQALTTAKVNVVSGDLITCSRSSEYSTPVVTVNFTISFNNTTEQQFSMNYKTKFKMHNY